MQRHFPRRKVLEMTGIDLDRFQSRQRRDQLPSSITMQDGSAYDGRAGYPLSDVLLLSLSDALTDLGFGPSQAKDLVRGYDVQQGLKKALEVKASGAEEVFCALTIWKADTSFEPSLVSGRNLLDAIKKASDFAIQAGMQHVRTVLCLDMSSRLELIRAGLDTND